MAKVAINIRLVEWSHNCGDGCCYTYGTDIYVNGKKLDQDGSSVHSALEAVLAEVGYKAYIEFE